MQLGRASQALWAYEDLAALEPGGGDDRRLIVVTKLLSPVTTYCDHSKMDKASEGHRNSNTRTTQENTGATGCNTKKKQMEWQQHWQW